MFEYISNIAFSLIRSYKLSFMLIINFCECSFQNQIKIQDTFATSPLDKIPIFN